jgi:enoyl-[acyl-carrier protein] reductase II
MFEARQSEILKRAARVIDSVNVARSEGGGHTGSVSSLVLLPQVVDMCAGTNLLVVGAGGIVNGRGIAAALALGAKRKTFTAIVFVFM